MASKVWLVRVLDVPKKCQTPASSDHVQYDQQLIGTSPVSITMFSKV